MKRFVSLILTIIICIVGSYVYAEGLLPQLTDVYGTGMPSLIDIIHRDPVSTETLEDGTEVLIYQDVQDADYEAYGELLASEGCILQEYTVNGNRIDCVITKGGKVFYFSYDTESHQAESRYPVGTFDEPRKIYIPKIAGETVFFGHYEQDNDLENGQEPVEWIVLDYDETNDKVFLLSRYGLDDKPYNNKFEKITWENCSLRAWLNKDFLNAAFSAEEQAAILTTMVDNSASQGYKVRNPPDERNTKDKVFLLSYAEANQYLGVTFANSDNIQSRVSPTDYAIKAGARTTDKILSVDGKNSGRWWLRSPGNEYLYKSYVTSSGTINAVYVDCNYNAVRPAIWVDLKSFGAKSLESAEATKVISISAEKPTSAPVTQPTTKSAVPANIAKAKYVKGSTSAEVLEIKKELQSQGYYDANVTLTGNYNDNMQEHIKKFQKDHGLKQTGLIDQAFLEALYGVVELPAEPEAMEDQSAAPAVGDKISFGTYEQDNNKSNGKEPIQWTVLAVDGNRMLVVSVMALDAVSYGQPMDVSDASRSGLSWENSYLRKWLNGTFLSAAFSADEKNQIVSTNLQTEDASGTHTTTDQVFVLGIKEADKYFSSAKDMACEATQYAKSGLKLDQGAISDDGYTSWWLRDLVSAYHQADQYNFMDTTLNMAGYIYGTKGTSLAKGGTGCPVFCDYLVSVRPAMWITWEQDIAEPTP